MNKRTKFVREPFLEHLGDAIRGRRIDLLLSQEELATRSGLYRSYVTEVEGGLRNVTVMTLLRLARALEHPLSETLLTAEASLKKAKDEQ
jgi:transcriptional regulator with XRE-family HTH domain